MCIAKNSWGELNLNMTSTGSDVFVLDVSFFQPTHPFAEIYEQEKWFLRYFNIHANLFQ